MKILSSLLLAAALTAPTIFAQGSSGSAGLTKHTVALPVGSTAAVSAASLKLTKSESLRPFEIAVTSDDIKPLKVYGVQTTSGLFIVDYPQTIPPKGAATFTLLYVAKQNSTETSDILRILTDRGEKVIQVNHDRAPAVQFDVPGLNWQQDEALTAKSVIITVAAKTVVPKAVRIMGNGHRATLESLGGDRYRVTVTPGSTAKQQQFPVFIDYSPSLPGVNTVISCAVVSKN